MTIQQFPVVKITLPVIRLGIEKSEEITVTPPTAIALYDVVLALLVNGGPNLEMVKTGNVTIERVPDPRP